MSRYRKIPVEIDAIQFDGDNFKEVFSWVTQFEGDENGPAFVEGDGYADGPYPVKGSLYIQTLEGIHECPPGWWVIRGVEGEYYGCKPSIFETTYEPVGLPKTEEEEE